MCRSLTPGAFEKSSRRSKRNDQPWLDEPLVAVCKTEAELANDVAKAYGKDYLKNPEVSVLAVEQKSQSVSVIGAVERPDYFINRKVHLLELLAFAGGPKTDEAGSRILVARAGSRSNCQNSAANKEPDDVMLMDFKFRDVQEGKQTLWMKPGDVVSVLDADLVYVYGNVNKQGSVKMKGPTTLTQAIVMAAGLKPATRKDYIRILRQKPGSTDKRLKWCMTYPRSTREPLRIRFSNQTISLRSRKTKREHHK